MSVDWFSASSRARRVFIAISILLLAAVLAWFFRPRSSTTNPLLNTPQLALASLDAKKLYFNEPARIWLLAQRADLLTDEDRDTSSERSRAFSQAVQNPKLFRELDRRYRFDALLLTGDPSQCRPLLHHLNETKDWTLRYVDSTSMIFRRGGERWKLADLQPVRAHFEKASASDRALFLAQTATKLLAVQYPAEARTLLDEAMQANAREPQVWNGMAIYHMDRGEWREALERVNRALEFDKESPQPLATKTQLLYGMKQFDAAFTLSQRLVSKFPNDPGVLFYHAKIAHEAHAYKAEIAVLQTLIEHANAASQPVGGYYLYLGQACAAASDAKGALDSFMLALNDPNLPDDQRAFARENIARIKKRTGL